MSQGTALLLSILIETPLALLFFWWVQRPTQMGQTIKLILISITATLVSHPLAWWLFQVLPAPYLTRFSEIEIGVFLLEGVIYYRFTSLNLINSLLVSLLTNGTSAGIGYLMVGLKAH